MQKKLLVANKNKEFIRLLISFIVVIILYLSIMTDVIRNVFHDIYIYYTYAYLLSAFISIFIVSTNNTKSIRYHCLAGAAYGYISQMIAYIFAVINSNYGLEKLIRTVQNSSLASHLYAAFCIFIILGWLWIMIGCLIISIFKRYIE